MALPGFGDILIILFILALILCAGKLSWAADHLGRLIERKPGKTEPAGERRPA